MIWAAPLVLASVAMKEPTFSHPDRIRFDDHCFTIDGKDTFIYSGAFHYFRCPRELWRARFKRIKDAGFNTVETYVPWNWSEQVPATSPEDHSHADLSDFEAWLKMAEDEFGLYVIVRPGPYICSEWSAGGFPNWLQAFKPAGYNGIEWYRSSDPVFEAWSRHWYQEVAAIVARHQLTHRPKGSHGVILWQVENEYDYDEHADNEKADYVRFLIKTSRELGIDVPIITCWTDQVRNAGSDPLLSQAFDCPNIYPNWHVLSGPRNVNQQHKDEPWGPKMSTEFQSGWFTEVGTTPPEDPIDDRQIKALTLWTIGNGLTGLNYYMLFGGTNFGDWAGQNITTTYDYNSPIHEWGGGSPRYQAVKAMGRFLAKYGSDVARADEVPSPNYSSSEGQINIISRRGPSGATYVFLWNPDQIHPAQGTLGADVKVDLQPFGCEVYRYTENVSKGEWCTLHKAITPATPERRIPIANAQVATLTPSNWRLANPDHCSTTDLSVWDSRFIDYRLSCPALKPSDTAYAWMNTPGSQLVGSDQPAPVIVDGGTAWQIHDKTSEYVNLNLGWPNIGRDMELPHAIKDLRITSELPNGTPLTSWRTKMIKDQSDRSLTGLGVDTSGWVEGTATGLFLPNTAGTLRSSFDFHPRHGKPVIFHCGGVDDEGWFYLNGRLIGEVHHYNSPVTIDISKDILDGHNELAIVIQNYSGPGGLTGDVTVFQHVDGDPSISFHLDWTDQFEPGVSTSYPLETGQQLPLSAYPTFTEPRPATPKLVESTIHFDCPDVNRPWQMVLKAGGDGFLTLNGHKLGRYWESGPQRAYYLPEPWLSRHNVLTLTVLPGRLGDRIQAAELRQIPVAQ